MEERKWPETIDEAVGVVLASLTEDDKSKITAMNDSDLVGLHFSLGLWIRNNFGLWQGNQKLMQTIEQQNPGIHPDDASMVIIEAVWDRLQEMKPKMH